MWRRILFVANTRYFLALPMVPRQSHYITMGCLFLDPIYWRDAYEQLWQEALAAGSMSVLASWLGHIWIVHFGGFYRVAVDGYCIPGGAWACSICSWCVLTNADWWFCAKSSIYPNCAYWTAKLPCFQHMHYRLVHIQFVSNSGDCGWFLYRMTTAVISGLVLITSYTILTWWFFPLSDYS